jgi:hypothetical protein
VHTATWGGLNGSSQDLHKFFFYKPCGADFIRGWQFKQSKALFTFLLSTAVQIDPRWEILSVQLVTRCCTVRLSRHRISDGMTRPVSDGMRYAPNVRRAQSTKKRRPAMKKISTGEGVSTVA